MGPVPIPTEVPTDVDLAALQLDLADDGVAILNPVHLDAQAQLAAVVDDAEAKGIDNFQIIVLAHDYTPDTSLRDLGNEVARASGEETSILVLAPGQAAAYSTGQLTRYQLEKAQDGHRLVGLTLQDPAAAAQDFVDIADGATFPWAGFTLALILVVAVAAGIARVVTKRESRAINSARIAAGLASGPDSGAVDK